MSYMTLFPSWCLLGKKDNESQSHIFMLHIPIIFGQGFAISSDGISLFPVWVKELLDMALAYHPLQER